jgi:hypothetical protein
MTSHSKWISIGRARRLATKQHHLRLRESPKRSTEFITMTQQRQWLGEGSKGGSKIIGNLTTRPPQLEGGVYVVIACSHGGLLPVLEKTSPDARSIFQWHGSSPAPRW